MDDVIAVIIDCGSGTVKAGIGGLEQPEVVFETVVGRDKDLYYKRKHSTSADWGEEELFVGDEALELRGMLKISYPINRGLVADWDDLEKVISYTFKKLELDPKECPVLLAEYPYSSTENRERLTSLMFEKFEVPGFYMGYQPTLSLYATGRTTGKLSRVNVSCCYSINQGLVVELGDSVSYSTAVFDGYQISHATDRRNIGGRDVNELLTRLLCGSGYYFSTSSELQIVREIKEKFCYVSADYRTELELSEIDKAGYQKRYTLPDGQDIVMGNELFSAPEVLFDPSQLGIDFLGIQHMAYSTFKRCDTTLRGDLMNAVLVSGGTSLLPGLAHRLGQEMNKIHTSIKNFTVLAPENRKHAVWIGGSLLSSLSTFNSMWIGSDEYFEEGASIIHERCNLNEFKRV